MWYLALNKHSFDSNPPWAELDHPVLVRYNPTLTVDEEQSAVVLAFRPQPTLEEQTVIRILLSQYTI